MIEVNKEWVYMSSTEREWHLMRLIEQLSKKIDKQEERIKLLELMHPVDQKLKDQLYGKV